MQNTTKVVFFVLAIMTISSTDKYRVNFLNTQQTRSQLGLCLTMFVASFLFADTRVNTNAIDFLMIIPILCVLLAILTILLRIPSLNYREIDESGMYITTLGFLRKHIRWSTIKKMDEFQFAGIPAIGINYKKSERRKGLGQLFRQKNFGWDELIGDGYSSSGDSFIVISTKQYEHFIKQSSH